MSKSPARGLNYGKVKVLIDSVSQGVIDLYASSQQWQYPICFPNLANTQHTIQVIPQHKKNPASSRYSVVVDAFRGPITALYAPANLALDIPLAADGEVMGVIKAVNPQDHTLTIQPNNGSKALKLKVNDDSEIDLNDDEVALADLRVGMIVDIEYDTATKTINTIDATDLNAPDADG